MKPITVDMVEGRRYPGKNTSQNIALNTPQKVRLVVILQEKPKFVFFIPNTGT